MYATRAWSAASATAKLAADTIPRRGPGPDDVQIAIEFCGICHSDLHYARNEWSDALPAVYPAVPGHEIVGRVTKVGAAVKGHAVGDRVAVGCFVDADLSCPMCRAGRENFCPSAQMTFGSKDRHGTAPMTYGGYSESIVVNAHFALRVPKNLDPARAAPLLCAGITTWSPLRRAQVGPGKAVGILGLGGLGHMGTKLARAMGAHVVVITTSPAKAEDARRLGAHDVIVSGDANQMKKAAGSLDFILDTVSAQHALDPYLALLRLEGNLTLVGVPPKPLAVAPFSLIMGNRSVSGSNTGGIPATREMLDFCGAHDIGADVEVIAIQQVNEAWARLERQDVRYRFVIDMASIARG